MLILELRKYRKDLITRLYRGTFFVLLLSMFATAIGNVIDGIIIGNNLGADSMAAFGFTTPLQKFIAILPSVLMLGMQILCSQKLGKGKLDEANGIFSLAMSIAVGVSILFMIMLFAVPEKIADLLGATENFGVIRTETINYFQAYSLGLPAMAAVTLLTPIMQLDSDRQRAVKAISILSAANVFGDLIAIFYFGGRMWEIGIATAISYWLSFMFLLLHFRNPEATFRFSFKDIKISNLREMFLTGSPVALGNGASMLQSGFFNYIAVSAGGGAGVAAVAIFNNLLSMLESFPEALASAMQMIAGIFIGEKDRNSILRLSRISLRSSALVSLSLTVILIFAAPLIADVYTHDNDTAVFAMVSDGIFWLALSLSFMTLNELPQYFYQAYGRFKLVNIMAVANNILFLVPCVLILTPHFGMTGIWAGFLLAKITFLLAIIFGVWYYHKKITFKREDMLLLEKDFDSAENPQLNISVTEKSEVLQLSKKIHDFCASHNVDKRKILFAAISVEEMARNIADYGFNDGQLHSIDIRVIISGENVTLRIRDDCHPFNPKKWYEIYNPVDPVAHIGIRLVSRLATEFNYVNVLKLNNLIIKI